MRPSYAIRVRNVRLARLESASWGTASVYHSLRTNTKSRASSRRVLLIARIISMPFVTSEQGRDTCLRPKCSEILLSGPESYERRRGCREYDVNLIVKPKSTPLVSLGLPRRNSFLRWRQKREDARAKFLRGTLKVRGFAREMSLVIDWERVR